MDGKELYCCVQLEYSFRPLLKQVYYFLGVTWEKVRGHHDLMGLLLQNVREKPPRFPSVNDYDRGLSEIGRWRFESVVGKARAGVVLDHLAVLVLQARYFHLQPQPPAVETDAAASSAAVALASFPCVDLRGPSIKT